MLAVTLIELIALSIIAYVTAVSIGGLQSWQAEEKTVEMACEQIFVTRNSKDLSTYS